MLKIIFPIFCVFSSFLSFSQVKSKSDSILSLSNDTNKVNIIIDYTWELRNSAPNEGLALAKKGLNISNDIDFDNGIIHLQNNIGTLFRRLGEYDSAIYYLKQSVDKSTFLSGTAKAENNLGLVYMDISDYEKSIYHFINAKKIYEEINHRKGIAGCLVNIGIINFHQGNQNKALQYYQSSLIVYEELGNVNVQAIILNNIGSVYEQRKQFDTALVYYNRSLEKYNKVGSKYGKATELNNISVIYYQKKEYSKSIYFEKQAIDIQKEIGNQQGIARSYSNISVTYGKMDSISKAFEYVNMAINLADEIGLIDELKSAYNQKGVLCKKIGDYKMAVECFEMHMKLKDSILNEENNKIISELEAKYENESKTKEIQLLETEAEASNAKLERNRIVQWSLAIGALLLLAVVTLIYWKFKESKRASKLVSEQKDIVDAVNEELNQTNEELAAQRDEIENQKKIVEGKNRDILDSIEYAKRIQKAIMPSNKEINKLYRNSFVYYLPKDIVSGDFYWFHKKKDTLYFAVVDCTGHGVPGAFMSMVGYNSIMHTIKNPRFRTPSEILTNMDRLVKATLSRTYVENNVEDGMDVSLCSLNTQTLELQFSGANSPLYLVKNKELLTVKGTKSPVGPSKIETIEFQNHIFQLSKGDIVYVTSDGYVDQFGGKNDKKFTPKRFRNLVSSISNLKIDNQKAEVENTFLNWKGEFDQIDDICVIGIRI